MANKIAIPLYYVCNSCRHILAIEYKQYRTLVILDTCKESNRQYNCVRCNNKLQIGGKGNGNT